MNKNSILAFLLIGLTVVFFNSPVWNNFYYGTVLKKPVPTVQRKVRSESQKKAEKPAKETIRETVTSRDSSEQKDTSQVEKSDSVKTVQREDSVIVETDKFIATVSTRGGRIVSLEMKDFHYNGERKGKMIDLVPQNSEGGAQLSINNESFDEKMFSTNADTSKPVKVNESYELVMETEDSGGNSIQKVFTFENDSYKIGYTVRGESLKNKKVILGWKGGIEESESGTGTSMARLAEKRRAHYSDGKTVQHMEMNKEKTEDPSGKYRWVGMSSKYFFVSIVSEELSDADLIIKGNEVSGYNEKNKEINYSVSYEKMAEDNEVEGWIYAGPSKVGELSEYGLKFDKILFPVLGWPRYILWSDSWFPPIAEVLLKVLLFFYGLVKDYGVAILLLTGLTKLITYPMVHSSTKSMNRLKEIQPKINALKQKYKNNPQKLQEEQMALFRAEGINPLNPGCLPMFLQMPILIALFVVLRKAVELRGAASAILPWINDLSQPEILFTLPFSIPLYGANVALLPIIMAAMTFFQQKMTISDPNQKAMVYFMPVIMLIMFNGFPAGVVFYWTLSSAFSLVQQWLMNKKKSSSVPVSQEQSSVKKGTRKTVTKK